MPDRLEHEWRPDVRNRQPVLKCVNGGCPTVWWPDRQQSRSACRGRPYAEVAADAVQALIIGGAA